MALPPDVLAAIMVAVALAMFSIHYCVSKKAGTLFFTYGLICSTATGLSIIAFLLSDIWPLTQAFADLGILTAGFAAFASAGWLRYAFRMTGDGSDR